MMMFNRKETDKFSSNPKTTILIETDETDLHLRSHVDLQVVVWVVWY
jgi:hypothetical protein